jgi:replicative DNA helicase
MNIESERYVLGSMLVNPDLIPVVRDFFHGRNMFVRPANRAIFEGMLETFPQLGRDISLVSLNEHLKDRPDYAAAGRAYLASLIDGVPGKHFSHHLTEMVLDQQPH